MSLRTGGREAVEDEQIEPTEMQIAIAERMFDEWCQYNGSDTGWSSSEVGDDTRSVWIELAGVAVAEIEYDHAIVRAEDALTAEDRAAIGRAYQHMSGEHGESQGEPYIADYDQWSEDIAVLSAIAAGGQE